MTENKKTEVKMTEERTTERLNDYAVVVNEQAFNKITNVELKEQIVKCMEAVQIINKGKWTYARAMNEIDVKEYWRVNFNTLDEFFETIGITKPTYYRQIAAVRMMDNLLVPNGYSEEQFEVTTASLFAVLRESAVAFIDSCKAKGIHLEKMSKTQVETEIKKYLKQLNSAVAGNEETEKEKKEPKPKIELVGKNKFLIKYNGGEWVVSVKQLNELKKAEEEAKAEKKGQKNG